jgi:gelsolin
MQLSATNLALFGSEQEEHIKLYSAQKESKFYEGLTKVPVGSAVGFKLWRVHNKKAIYIDNHMATPPKFGIELVPNNSDSTPNNNFYTGDSYILLYTYNAENTTALRHNIHFWIGSTTTQDEMGVAAYKSMELDTLLGGIAVIYREPCGHESNIFLGYFAQCGGLCTRFGGYETGFHHVGFAAAAKPKLLKITHIMGRTARSDEIPIDSTLNNNKVYILDVGITIYQYYGALSNKHDRYASVNVVADLLRNRSKCKSALVDSDTVEFWNVLGIKPIDVVLAERSIDNNTAQHTLYCAVDNTFKKLDTAEPNRKISSNLLHSDGIYIYDTNHEVYVWVGEHAKGLNYTSYVSNLQSINCNNNRPIIVIKEDNEPDSFMELF